MLEADVDDIEATLGVDGGDGRVTSMGSGFGCGGRVDRCDGPEAVLFEGFDGDLDGPAPGDRTGEDNKGVCKGVVSGARSK